VQTSDRDDLLAGLVTHKLARPVLHVLARGEPLSYSDLHAAVRIAVTGRHAHAKTFDSALHYLRNNRLITRSRVRPNSTRYAVTEAGRDVARFLAEFRQLEYRHRRPQQPGPTGHTRPAGR
jgi:DNA-binding PadR family transcriptional regulator